MTTPQQQKRRRPRSRGVAALEFALSLAFLAPLAGAAVDFGYYFYVGSSAEEAARAGLREAILAYNAAAGAGTSCIPGGAGVAKAAIVRNDGQNASKGEAFKVMDQAPLLMAGNTQVQISCDADPIDPSWHILVRVDFVPAMGFVTPFLPAGSASVPAKVRYNARLHGN